MKGKLDYGKFVSVKTNTQNLIYSQLDSLVGFLEVNHEEDVSYEVIDMAYEIEPEELEAKVTKIINDFEVVRVKGHFRSVSGKLFHLEATKNNLELKETRPDVAKLSMVFIGKILVVLLYDKNRATHPSREY